MDNIKTEFKNLDFNFFTLSLISTKALYFYVK